MAGRRALHPLSIPSLALVLVGWLGAARPLHGLQVPQPDSAAAPVPGAGVDTLQAQPETLDGEEREVRNLPERPRAVPAAWRTGVWEWDTEALLSTAALTLLELLEEVPGVVPIRGGDYGQPEAATSFGVGGGRVRVFLDGVEMPPLDGGVVDLSRVGLGGIGTVRVERRPGEFRVELLPLRFEDARPLSLLEVGTGDLNTNFFRGTFAHPFVLGGTFSISLDRIDTEGPFRVEPGVSFGAHVRHALFLGERLGLAWELRRRTSRRPFDLWAPARVGRSDLGLHARIQLAAGFLAEAFLLRSSLDAEGEVGEAGEVEPPIIDEDPRTGAGIRLSGSRREGWLEVEARAGWGDGLASSGQRLRAGWEGEAIGGADVEVERERWRGEALSNVHGRVWTRPLWGASLFAEAESGRRGVRASPFFPRDDEIDGEPELPMEEGAPDPSVTDRSGYRAGIELRRGDLVLGTAWLRVEADSLHPTGLPIDRGAEAVRGGERTGVEAVVRIPLTPLLPGLELAGSVQRWDRAREWRYLPRHRYQGGVHFHDVFLESGNLEVWADVAVGGRDPMSVPLRPEEGGATSGSVPFQQSWFARIQIRIVSARVFVLWENFTLRENNQDVPGRLLPATRALYGVRWTLWN